MPLTLKVRDYRGVERADLSIGGLLLVAGPNGAGKSSLAQAAAAALTGTALLPGVLKKNASVLVKDGNKTGSAVIEGSDGVSSVTWPKGEYETSGSPPRSKEWAAGRGSILDLKPDERGEILARELGTEPVRDDLDQALRDAGVYTEQVANHVWTAIEKDGWDIALDQLKGTLHQRKGGWEQVTGERFGIKKADGWVPADGWDVDLKDADPDPLAEEVRVAKEIHEAAIAARSVDEHEVRRLRDEAAKMTDLRNKSDEANLSILELQKTVNHAEGELRALPSAQANALPKVGCPHCGEPIVIDGRKLYSPKEFELSLEVITERQNAIAAATDKVDQAKNALIEARANNTELGARMRRSREARDQLERIESSDAAAAAVTSRLDIETTREAIVKAEARLHAWKVWTQATELFGKVQVATAVAAILAPDGLRKRVLGRALSPINETLAEFSRSPSIASGSPAIWNRLLLTAKPSPGGSCTTRMRHSAWLTCRHQPSGRSARRWMPVAASHTGSTCV